MLFSIYIREYVNLQLRRKGCGYFTCVHVGVKDIRFLEEVILLHGGVPIRRDFLPRDVAGNATPGTTIKIMTHVPIVPVVERVRVRQVVRPRLSVLAQLEKSTFHI